MKVYIEIPDGWIDADSPMLWVSRSVKEEARKVIREEMVKQYLDKIELPELNITTEEIKQRVLDKLAEKAIREINHD